MFKCIYIYWHLAAEVSGDHLIYISTVLCIYVVMDALRRSTPCIRIYTHTHTHTHTYTQSHSHLHIGEGGGGQRYIHI